MPYHRDCPFAQRQGSHQPPRGQAAKAAAENARPTGYCGAAKAHKTPVAANACRKEPNK